MQFQIISREDPAWSVWRATPDEHRVVHARTGIDDKGNSSFDETFDDVGTQAVVKPGVVDGDIRAVATEPFEASALVSNDVADVAPKSRSISKGYSKASQVVNAIDMFQGRSAGRRRGPEGAFSAQSVAAL